MHIPVRYVKQEANGQLSVILEENDPTILWAPSDTGVPEWYSIPDQDDGFNPENILVTPVHTKEGSTEVLPMPEEQD